jgi:hypothetical protein
MTKSGGSGGGGEQTGGNIGGKQFIPIIVKFLASRNPVMLSIFLLIMTLVSAELTSLGTITISFRLGRIESMRFSNE